MKPEDRKRLKQHIEMIVEHKEPDVIAQENFKKLQDEVADLREKNIKLRLELRTLRFKEAQENRFVWWIYQVYAKNVTDFCVAVKTRIPVDYQFGRIDELYKRIKEYTGNIYDGTYLDTAMSTEQSNSDVSMTQDVLTDIKTEQSIENTNPDYCKDELYLDEDFRMLAKTYPADVSAIGVTTLIDYVEALEAELARRINELHYANTVCMEQKHKIARRDEIIARLKEDGENLAMNFTEDNVEYGGSYCIHCHHTLDDILGVISGGHEDNCPITLHRQLMKELK